MLSSPIPAYESAAHTAIRNIFVTEELQPVLTAFLRHRGTLSLNEPCVVIRESDRLEEERIRGAALIMVAGLCEVDVRIEARTRKARRMGASHVFLFVPRFVRIDENPQYAEHCNAIYFALPWVGDAEGSELPQKCHYLRTNAL